METGNCAAGYTVADVPATIMQSARSDSSKQPSSTSAGIGSPNDTVSLFKMPSQCGHLGGSSAKSIASRPKRAMHWMQRTSVALPWISRRRPRLRQRVPELAHGAGGIQPLLPGRARVTQETLVAVHRRLAVLGPESTGSAERRDPALDGQPCARQRDHVARATDALRGRVESGGARLHPKPTTLAPLPAAVNGP